jgi:hypothetical protein
MAITKFLVTSVESGKTATVDFGSTILNASVAVQGYSVSFGTNVDHHVKAIKVNTSISSITGSSVTVGATCTMEDNSSHKANGTVNVLVVAVCD